jgi:hypothetical protein
MFDISMDVDVRLDLCAVADATTDVPPDSGEAL